MVENYWNLEGYGKGKAGGPNLTEIDLTYKVQK